MTTLDCALTWANDYTMDEAKRAERIQGCHIGRLFIKLRKHNAWHGRESISYLPGYDFHTSLAQAKHNAECSRRQGRHHTIHEAPCLVLRGRGHELVLSSPHRFPSGPASMRPVLFGPTIGEAYGRFRRAGSVGLNLHVAKAGTIPPASLPFRRHESRSQGSPNRDPLAWAVFQHHVDTGPILGLHAEVFRFLQRHSNA